MCEQYRQERLLGLEGVEEDIGQSFDIDKLV